MVPEVSAIMERATADRWLTAAQPGGEGISHHGRSIWKDAADVSAGESSVSQPDVEGFDCVGNHARIKATETVKFFLCQRAGSGHSDPSQMNGFLRRTGSSVAWMRVFLWPEVPGRKQAPSLSTTGTLD
jgi:hypothetical protein